MPHYYCLSTTSSDGSGNVPPPRVHLYNLPCHEFISILGGDFIFVEMFMPFWGKISILTNIFQVGWNHQLEFHDLIHQTSRWNNDPLRLDMSRRVLRSTFASVLTKKATPQGNIARTKRCEFYQFQQWQTYVNTTLDGDLDKNFMSPDRYVHTCIPVYPSINLCMRMYNDVPSTSQEVQDLEIDTELPHSFKANSFYEKNTTHHICTHDYRYMLISHLKCISVLILFLKTLQIHIIYHPIPSM